MFGSNRQNDSYPSISPRTASVSVLASSVVDRGFVSRSSQTKDYKIGICCFSAKHAALGRKSKGWLVRNQDMFKWGDMSISMNCCFRELDL
jgi:hypothetical protein